MIRTEEMTISMGPQHPATHGVLRFIVKTDGEVLHEVKPDVGYLHRSMEKIAEKVGYISFQPYTDRIDYVCAMTCNHAYAMAVEKAAGISAPERAEYLRVIASELNRISSHLIMAGVMAMDIGAFTPFIHAIRERETVNDLFEMLCGARLTYNYVRIGGVSFDAPANFKEKCVEFLNHFEPIIDEFNRLISFNKIYVERLANVGVVSREDAIAYNLVGPNLRGSGVRFDVRKDIPYSIYPKIDFNVPVGIGEAGKVGDCYDRYMIRIREMKESCKIVRQALEQMPEGEIMAKVPRKIKPPVTEVYSRCESARGDMGFYLVSDGTDKPYRLKIRTGSFSAMSIVEKIAPGLMIADLVAFISSLDVVAPEVDR
ncbi:MAG: NADH-quinone oxidoreductase subunit D [Deltaproteobacteria bacterium]|nr:NADH-quinone oxidoreductase subunit D [Deltaproteobacteria bacterium]MBI2342205.1 NADH-quinone oxidoreductase subunit D [Deltaproteobacteria bacterium]